MSTVEQSEQGSMLDAGDGKAQHGPVECLGMTFESDEARREYFSAKLREKLQDLEFRAIEGFPVGSDEDILRLSDPPYYTACPNPFLAAFVQQFGTSYDPANDDYHREPFAVDVSEGKTDPLYAAHSYHTKVPYKAIIPAVLHYTNPGDLVLDGFAGSGMTGIAAQMCGSPDAGLHTSFQAAAKEEGAVAPERGARRAILNDLSPAATAIAANYNLPFSLPAFEREAKRILVELEAEIGWMYQTLHTDGQTVGRIQYTVWSEVFTCPNCGREVIFFKEALDQETKRVRERFPCPHCAANLTKDNLSRVMETLIDPLTGHPRQRIRLVPVLVRYSVGKARYEKTPDKHDLERLEQIARMPLPSAVPEVAFPLDQMYHGTRLGPKGFTDVHHLYLPRAVQALGILWEKAAAVEDSRLRHMLQFFVDQAVSGMSVLNRYSPTHFSQVNRQLTGVYYVASQHSEVSPWYILDGKLERLVNAFRRRVDQDGYICVSTATAASLPIPTCSVDYVFTDPPFGANIPYADLNLLVEAWYRVRTDAKDEAIVDQPKDKGLPEYQRLMQSCFEEYHRVLKPGRWMTVVFHNSQNSVWNAIQEALLAAGFVVADVRTLDKQQGSYRQVTSTAVKQDLVISTYKPSYQVESRFKLEAGTEETAWDFVRSHLQQLPVFVGSVEGRAQAIPERMNYLLFDRMVAFHLSHGATIPFTTAAQFYSGLDQRFPERDAMYFLPSQVADYDKKRLQAKEVQQIQLFVTDESSAIQWLRQQLRVKPQTFQDVHPQFMKEIAGWERYEKPLELSSILAESFLRYDGRGEVPSQIHSYLSTNYKDLRNLSKDDPALQAAAKDRWYVPDSARAQDLEKIRERDLLKEFEEYRTSRERQLKVFRLEAVRAGFKRAWQEHAYLTIVTIAQKIPDSVLQEDPKLLMWYDQALLRSGAEK